MNLQPIFLLFLFNHVFVAQGEWKTEESDIVHLTDENFEQFIARHDRVLIAFHSSACTDCQLLRPEYESAAQELTKKTPILAAVDGSTETKLIQKMQIKTFPTLKYYFTAGHFEWNVEARDRDGLLDFINDPKKPIKELTNDVWYTDDNPVYLVTPRTIRKVLADTDHALVMFYVDGCPHCISTKPKFMEAARIFEDTNGFNFYALNCDDEAVEFCNKEFNAKWVPTIIYFRNGKKVQRYYFPRETEDFVAYMSNAPRALDFETFWKWEKPIRVLTDENANQTLAKYKRSLIFYYVPYDQESQELRKIYIEAAKSSENPKYLYAVVDCIEYQPFCNKRIPTVKAFPKFRVYEGKEFAFVFEGDFKVEYFLDVLYQDEPRDRKTEL